MKGYNYATGESFDTQIPEMNDDARYAIIANPNDINEMIKVFDWDESTIHECTSLDESVRYNSYDQYDFISLIYASVENESFDQWEINIFFSKHYIIFMFPEESGQQLDDFKQKLREVFAHAATRPGPLTYLFYFFFDKLTADFATMLEALEDEHEELSDQIGLQAVKDQAKEIRCLRKAAYTYHKLLRAISYIGEQILVDENELLDVEYRRFFRSIGSRLIKLHDFADNIMELSHELLHLYDSKLASETNDALNKLTIITLFFGPLTVIAGIYGMNFDFMPELHWRYGYLFSLGLMVTISAIIYAVLKKKKWI